MDVRDFVFDARTLWTEPSCLNLDLLTWRKKKKNQEVEKNDLSTKYLILNANALPEVCYYPRLTLYFVLKPILISLQSYKYI